MCLSKPVIIGYITSLAGTALWLYGYFEAGHPALIDWHTYTPWWIADFLPNMESEIGMALVFASTVLMYWAIRAGVCFRWVKIVLSAGAALRRPRSAVV